MTNYELMKSYYGGEFSIDTAVRILSEDHPCNFCAKKCCDKKCEEGVKAWLLKESKSE